MQSHKECLNVLGLQHGASWPQINEAYRDLVRVWHPDRFQNDERLRLRAEEQTRTINNAIQRLREGYDPKSAPQKEDAASPIRPPAAETSSTTRANSSTAPERDEFVDAPILLVYEKGIALGAKMLVGVALGFSSYVSFTWGDPHPYKAAFGSLVGLLASHNLVRGCVGIALRRPAIAVDIFGMSQTDSGKLSWPDIQRAWAFVEARSPALAIECSETYLQRQAFFRRTLLRLRHAFRSAHLVVRFGGMHSHPSEVVSVLTAVLDSGRARLREATPRPSVGPGVLLARALALLAAATLMARCLTADTLNLLEIALYLLVFAGGLGWDLYKKRQLLPSPTGSGRRG